MSVNSHYVRNAQNIFQKVNSTVGRINKQKGGDGRSVTQKGMDTVSSLNMGRGYSPAVNYSHCGGIPRPGNQVGGVSYGFTKSGAALSAPLKGSYPVPTKMEKSKQCGGDRSDCAYKQHPHGKLGGRKRKSRKKFRKHSMWNKKGKKYRVKTYKQHLKGVRLGHTHKKPKKRRRKKSIKRKSKRRKSKRRKTRRRKTRRRRKRQKGGRINYSSPNPGPSPWATGPGSFERHSSPPFATYNHYLRE
jgi:hypothetical protein